MSKMIATCKRFLADESGASMVEYALMVALIAVVAYAAVQTLGTNISTQLNAAATKVGT